MQPWARVAWEQSRATRLKGGATRTNKYSQEGSGVVKMENLQTRTRPTCKKSRKIRPSYFVWSSVWPLCRMAALWTLWAVQSIDTDHLQSKLNSKNTSGYPFLQMFLQMALLAKILCSQTRCGSPLLQPACDAAFTAATFYRCYAQVNVPPAHV